MRPTCFAKLPFRLGTTSYIIPDEILPNVRYLADQVDDVELVLFEADDYSNLPSPALVDELNAIAKDNELTFTVHLPLNLKFTRDDAAADISIEKALKVIGCTEKLYPYAYIAHLDSHQIGCADETSHPEMVENCLKALERIAPSLPDRRLLAIENLESYDPERNDPVVQRFGASHCIDIGHLWLRGRDPLPYFKPRLDRSRVVHLHGIEERDHRSLTAFQDNRVQLTWRALINAQFDGVLTLEVFNEADFFASMELLKEIT